MILASGSVLLSATLFFCLATAFGADAAPPPANPVVVLQTSMGDITIELFNDKAPKSVANFLAYVNSGFYRGTIFHRVIRDFMIQGGGFTADMAKKDTRPPIANEATNGLSNKKGTIAMARTAVVDSATAQFFINVKDNPGLDHRGTTPDAFGYAVFGRVTEGMEVVEKIRGAATGAKGQYSDVPLSPIVINDVKVKS